MGARELRPAPRWHVFVLAHSTGVCEKSLLIVLHGKGAGDAIMQCTHPGGPQLTNPNVQLAQELPVTVAGAEHAHHHVRERFD